MKNIIKNIAFSMTCAAVAIFMGSCDTDVESVDINDPSIENQNPKLYEAYLSSLRAYKASEHKVTFGWFDNSEKNPFNEGQHINAVPDSLDYIVLIHPDSLSSTEMKEIQQVRDQKGTKVIYEINFDNIKNIYDKAKTAFESEEDNAGKTYPEFNSYLVDSVNTALDICTRYNYDGVIMTYTGKLKMYLDDNEKIQYTGYENDFLGIATDWATRHPDKDFIIQGRPQNVIDVSVFNQAKYILIDCTGVKSQFTMSHDIDLACADGVATDKFVPVVSNTSADTSDKNTGYWEDGSNAVLGTAKWVRATHDGFSVVGMGIYNINPDYFNAAFTYSHVRTAIQTINPSVKK